MKIRAGGGNLRAGGGSFRAAGCSPLLFLFMGNTNSQGGCHDQNVYSAGVIFGQDIERFANFSDKNLK